MTEQQINACRRTANRIRMDIVESIHAAKSGHPGGSLSIADLLTYLYFERMHIDPAAPEMPDRDRLVLSKGHAAPALYAALARRGYFPPEELIRLRKPDSMLAGHPDKKHIPGVDMSSGSLGQGISAACGMALAGKYDHADYRVYAILGDGECNEGEVWEAAMFAAAKKLDNLTAFVDFNNLQIDGTVTEVNGLLPIDEKFAAFGWQVLTVDGHDFEQLDRATETALATKGKPTVIVMKTVKGKGVSYMENACGWHGTAPNDEQFEQAMNQLRAAQETL